MGLVSMKEIIGKAKINAKEKPVFDVKLNHLADWRTKTEQRVFINKLDVLHSFVVLREMLCEELDRVVMTEADIGSETKI